jgi:hypothetical protein
MQAHSYDIYAVPPSPPKPTNQVISSPFGGLKLRHLSHGAFSSGVAAVPMQAIGSLYVCIRSSDACEVATVRYLEDALDGMITLLSHAACSGRKTAHVQISPCSLALANSGHIVSYRKCSQVRPGMDRPSLSDEPAQTSLAHEVPPACSRTSTLRSGLGSVRQELTLACGSLCACLIET